jgi:hypothetical protein
MRSEGRDRIAGIATRYGLDGPGIKCRLGRDFPHPSRLALGPTHLPIQWVSDLFPEGKAAGAWRWLFTPSSAEVQERVELYLYSPSGSSWPVLGRTLLFTCGVNDRETPWMHKQRKNTNDSNYDGSCTLRTSLKLQAAWVLLNWIARLNEATNCVLSDRVNGLYQGVPYFLVTWLNEISFVSVRVSQPSLLRFSRDIHMLNSFLVNKTNRCTEFQFYYWYYDSTCFGQFFCPSSGVS